MTPITTSEVGRWNEELFVKFRRARGEKKRVLLSELLRVNGPLVKILVGQIAGIADEKTTTRRRRPTRMRVNGADQVPWDDLMQAGLQGMAHALGKFDPAKGKISGYARWWILTNIQRLVRKEAMIKTPDREPSVGVSLINDEAELDRLSTDHNSGELAEVPGVTPELIDQWRRTDTWPDSLEELRERTRVYSVPRPAFTVFLEVHCVIKPSGRAPLWPLWNTWRVECAIDRRPAGSQIRFLAALADRSVKETRIRTRYRGGSPSVPERGLAGLRIVA